MCVVWNDVAIVNPQVTTYFGDEDGISTLSQIDEFDGAKENWPQKLEHFFVANRIDS